jgi:hypothetical protein
VQLSPGATRVILARLRKGEEQKINAKIRNQRNNDNGNSNSNSYSNSNSNKKNINSNGKCSAGAKTYPRP